MKSTLTIFVLLSLLMISCNSKSSKIPEISKGKIDQKWYYENETMKFKFQLPRNWNLADSKHPMTNYIPMNQDLTQNILGTDRIKIEETFNLMDESSIYQLFSVSKNTTEDIRTGNRKGDLGFAVVSSQTGNADDDIEAAQKEIQKQLKDSPEALKINEKNLSSTESLLFGKDKIPYFKFTNTDISGNPAGNRLYAFKNYGNYNLIVLITYFSENELDEIKDVLKTIEN